MRVQDLGFFGFWIGTLTFWTHSTHAAFPRRNLASLLTQSVDTCQVPVLNQTSSLDSSWVFLSLSEAQHNSPFACWFCLVSPEALSTYWRLYTRAFRPTRPFRFSASVEFLPLLFPLGSTLSLATIRLWQSSKTPAYLRAHLWLLKMGSKREHLAFSILNHASLTELSEKYLMATTSGAQHKFLSHPCLATLSALPSVWGRGRQSLCNDVQGKVREVTAHN